MPQINWKQAQAACKDSTVLLNSPWFSVEGLRDIGELSNTVESLQAAWACFQLIWGIGLLG